MPEWSTHHLQSRDRPSAQQATSGAHRLFPQMSCTLQCGPPAPWLHPSHSPCWSPAHPAHPQAAQQHKPLSLLLLFPCLLHTPQDCKGSSFCMSQCKESCAPTINIEVCKGECAGCLADASLSCTLLTLVLPYPAPPHRLRCAGWQGLCQVCVRPGQGKLDSSAAAAT
jgi:hypothetical protein